MASSDPKKKDEGMSGMTIFCIVLLIVCLCISIISAGAGGSPFIQFIILMHLAEMFSQ